MDAGDYAAPQDRIVFFGEYEHNIDEKGRVSLNAGLRVSVPAEEQARGYVLTQGHDKCLAVYTVSEFIRRSAQMEEARFGDPSTRAYVRDIFRKATLVKCDSQGRIVVPQRLRAAAHLKKQCVEIGVRDHIEIWSKELYDAYWIMNDGAAEKGGEEMPF